MNWNESKILVGGKSGTIEKRDYVSIAKDARVRCTAALVKIFNLNRYDGVLIRYLQKDKVIGFTFCRYRQHKNKGAKKVNKKEDGSIEFKIMRMLKEANLAPPDFTGKYKVEKERYKGSDIYFIRLKESLG